MPDVRDTDRRIARAIARAELNHDYGRANWIRSQEQEIRVCLDRGDDWPEVWGR